jgi:hypothetical protein
MKKNLFLGKWLLVAIILMISSPLSIGRGKGGGGNNNPNCTFMLSNDKLPVSIHFDYDGYQRPPNCSIPFAGSNPYSPNVSYQCIIVVSSANSKCEKFYSKIYEFPNWDALHPPFYVEALRDDPMKITVTFRETCNTCMPVNFDINYGKIEYTGSTIVSPRASIASVSLHFNRIIVCS